MPLPRILSISLLASLSITTALLMQHSVAQPVPTNTAASTSFIEQLSNSLPAQVKQGEVVWLDIEQNPDEGQVSQVSFLGKVYPVFPQENNHITSVIPVPVDYTPGSYMVSLKDNNGTFLASKAIKVTSAGYSKQNIRVSSSVGGIQPEPGELAAIGNLKTHTNPSKQLWDKDFTAPTPDCMNSPFGNLRYHNGKFTGNYHKGIDLKSPMGRPIKAPTDGIVTIARPYRLHGGTVGLDHGQGLSSVYIHMSKILVKPGQNVAKGEVIGHVGSTGFATGPHLHWGLYANGQPVNPIQWTPQIKACGR